MPVADSYKRIMVILLLRKRWKHRANRNKQVKMMKLYPHKDQPAVELAQQIFPLLPCTPFSPRIVENTSYRVTNSECCRARRWVPPTPRLNESVGQVLNLVNYNSEFVQLFRCWQRDCSFLKETSHSPPILQDWLRLVQ